MKILFTFAGKVTEQVPNTASEVRCLLLVSILGSVNGILKLNKFKHMTPKVHVTVLPDYSMFNLLLSARKQKISK